MRVKLALVGLGLLGVLVFAGTIAYVGDPPAAKAKKPDPAALAKQAARRMFNAANRNDAHTFCHSFSEKIVADAGMQEDITKADGSPNVAASYRYCEANASQPGALDSYHTRNVYIAPRVVWMDGNARLRIRLDGHWFFFYFHRDSDGVWRFLNTECLSCGVPGGVRSGEVA